uniref:Natural killer cell receptor 2B4 immunoglobulin domain-containing protein n=1 Tax=Chelonoidis abingdonii TaxID=106734 RepID=A0A8C0IXF3_CHEAB
GKCFPAKLRTQLTLHSTALCTFEPPGCKEMEVAAIAGESVQLLPLKLPESWTEITWEVTLDSAETYGIVTFHKGEPPDHGSSPHFINRVTFHPDNLSLQIDPVKKSDSGLYSLQTETGGACVTDSSRLPQHLSPGSLLSDRVRQPNLTVLSAHLEDHQLPGNQSLLHVAINADSSDIFYRCNASNRRWQEVLPLCVRAGHEGEEVKGVVHERVEVSLAQFGIGPAADSAASLRRRGRGASPEGPGRRVSGACPRAGPGLGRPEQQAAKRPSPPVVHAREYKVWRAPCTEQTSGDPTSLPGRSPGGLRPW